MNADPGSLDTSPSKLIPVAQDPDRDADQRDPKVLAQLACNRARAKISQLEQALEGAGFFAGAYAGLLKALLERIYRTDEEIACLSQVFGQLLAPMRNSCSRPTQCLAGDGVPPRT